MGKALQLDQFDAPDSGGGTPTDDVAGQDNRLSAFEDGYKAGWDDATASQNELQSAVTSDLASHLQDLSFTFHEARSHVVSGIAPLVEGVLAPILPTIAREALPQIIMEQIADLVGEAANTPVTLSIAPDSREALLSVLPAEPGFPLEVREEPTLAAGQVFMRFEGRETEIDTHRVIEEIQDAVRDFFARNDERIAANG